MKKMVTHVKVWLAAASLHQRGMASFSPGQLEDEVERLFAERSLTVKTFISAHANGSAPKNNPTVYNHTVRLHSGDVRLSLEGDTFHPSRVGAARWPDQAAVDEPFWPLWQFGRAFQQGLATSEVAATAAVASSPPAAPQDANQKAVLEHLLVAELMRQLWPVPLEVFRPDATGTSCDLILCTQGVLRQVRLESAFLGAAPPLVEVDEGLWGRQGGCVVWALFDPATLQPAELYWLEQPLSSFVHLHSVSDLLQRLFGVTGNGPMWGGSGNRRA